MGVSCNMSYGAAHIVSNRPSLLVQLEQSCQFFVYFLMSNKEKIGYSDVTRKRPLSGDGLRQTFLSFH